MVLRGVWVVRGWVDKTGVVLRRVLEGDMGVGLTFAPLAVSDF